MDKMHSHATQSQLYLQHSSKYFNDLDCYNERNYIREIPKKLKEK